LLRGDVSIEVALTMIDAAPKTIVRKNIPAPKRDKKPSARSRKDKLNIILDR
jgi:hypothetical protein